MSDVKVIDNFLEHSQFIKIKNIISTNTKRRTVLNIVYT